MEDKIKEKLKELVKPKRYKHSMVVAEEARKLAKIYNEPVEKAYLTGLAHDIAKSFDNKENSSPVLERLEEIDPLKCTPMDAINLLYELKELSKK